MADKKNDADSGETARLEKHVDEMMDPKLPDTQADTAMKGVPELPGDAPEIDIFKGKKQPANLADPADKQPADESPVAAKGTEDLPLDSNETDEVVDDIVAREGDELLAAQDAEVSKAFDGHRPSFKERLQAFLARWWDNKLARYGTLAGLVVLVVVAAVVPVSRYAVLNTFGMRTTASMTILDGTTSLPLKNVNVTLGHTTEKTNDDGVAKLTGLKLGSQKMTIEQLGFATVMKTVVLGMGSNPLENVSLKAVGMQYEFIVTDYVSGKPVASAEASAGDANAQADDKGQIILTIGGANPGPQFSVLLNANGYRQEKLTVDATTKTSIPVVMVTTQKEVFVSKQSGKYDVYRVDADGKNKQLLLAGTGLERPQITLVSHPTDNVVALVSSRNDNRNQDGYLLDTLTAINVDTGAVLQLDQSEQIKIVDWIGDKLVYVKVKAGTSAGNSERYQLMSYDYSSSKRLQLATANNFADIVAAKGVLYYATANYYTPGQSQFVSINPDGTGKQVLLNNQVWNILRNSYSDLELAGAYSGNTQSWYSYRLGDTSANNLSQAPTDASANRFYLDSADGKKALWTDTRDGKGVLLVYDDPAKKDTVLVTQSGLTTPLRWLDSRTVIYRVVTPQETADYVVSLDGGTPHKVVDVTNVQGLAPWNYGY